MEHVLLFTKYPTPGYAKTRLIPAVGAERAADISRELSEHAIGNIRAYIDASTRLTEFRVYFALRTADDKDKLMEWLHREERESTESFHEQSSGGLGERLCKAFASSFEAGASKVLVVGADIPEIDSNLLDEGFQKLDKADVVIGPAEDGGYYLLGMKKLASRLFEDMQWSTSTVFETTLQRANELSLSILQLKRLRDVDEPDDIEYFNKIMGEIRK